MGSTLEVLKQIADKFLDKQNSPEGKTNEHGLLSDISNSNPSEENLNEAHETQNNAEKERTSFFQAAERSFWLRQFPRLSKLFDITHALGISKPDPEVVPWQHEFEYFTAFASFLVPDKYLKIITDHIAQSSTFQTLVNHWPLINGVDLPLIGPNGKLLDKIKAGDPQAVIDAIRIMHQDIFVTGKISITDIYDIIKKYAGGDIAKVIVGGGGLAGLGILGNKLINQQNNSVPQESIIQKGEDLIKHELGLEVNLGNHSFKDILQLNPNLKLTTAQTNLI